MRGPAGLLKTSPLPDYDSSDYICNWVGNEHLVLNLEWSGKKAFNDAALREWEVVGERAGVTRSAMGLTFATVDHAGHLVRTPHSLDLFSLKRPCRLRTINRNRWRPCLIAGLLPSTCRA